MQHQEDPYVTEVRIENQRALQTLELKQSAKVQDWHLNRQTEEIRMFEKLYADTVAVLDKENGPNKERHDDA